MEASAGMAYRAPFTALKGRHGFAIDPESPAETGTTMGFLVGYHQALVSILRSQWRMVKQSCENSVVSGRPEAPRRSRLSDSVRSRVRFPLGFRHIDP